VLWFCYFLLTWCFLKGRQIDLGPWGGNFRVGVLEPLENVIGHLPARFLTKLGAIYGHL
jgi:hypothetical protein